MINQSPLDLARDYLGRGLSVLPVEYRGKRPFHNGRLLKDWQHLRLTADELSSYFNGQPQNIGVHLGEPSHDLVDVDLDCAEAVMLAPLLLPPTGSIFGRASRRRSHWLYHANFATKKFRDPLLENNKDEAKGEKAMLVEIRSTGTQTVFPGSVHESGELITWDSDGDAARVEAKDIVHAVAWLAAICLLARYWPRGSRNDAANALAGGLLRLGFSEVDAVRFMEAVCLAAQDEETRSRIRNVVDTAAKLRSGSNVTGWPTLAKIVDGRIVDRVCEWLEVKASARVAEKAGDSDGTTNTHGYKLEAGCLARLKPTRDGQTLVQLCNFDARIITDVIEDDGATERRVYQLRGKLASRDTYSTVNVSADEFAAMRWMDRLLGATATVYAGQGEHVRCAVRLLSDRITQSTVYTHTG